MKKYILLIAILLLSPPANSQWQLQIIPVNKPVTGLEFVDSLKGWAVTSWGSEQDSCYILHTINGGTDWLVQHRMSGNSWDCIDMLNSLTGYIGGGPSNAVIFKTIDGGKNWINIPNPISVFIEDIFFLNKDSGYVCNSIFRDVWRTSDGGQSWQIKNNGISASGTRRLFFLNYNTGYCGATGALFKTTNAGENWFGISGFQNSIISIFFLDEETGWIGGGNSGGNGTMWTTNGGINWSLGQGGSGGYDIIFLNNRIGWAGNVFPNIIKSTDAGLNWYTQILDSTSSRNISMIDTLLGWTGRERIAKTTNGGLSFINSNTEITPDDYKLYQNYPNPFNSQTKISFEIVRSSNVKLNIYDITGREISRWKSEGLLPSGRHEFLFNAERLSSGIYFYKLEVTGLNGSIIYSDSRKMIYLK
jgi:photosystem II stability/assembly factor-like uncharacterized protein